MASVTVTIRAASNAAAARACLRSSVGSRPSMMAAAYDNLYIRVRDKGKASYRFAGGGGNRHKHRSHAHYTASPRPTIALPAEVCSR